MSPYYSSSSLPADAHQAVRQRVDAWLEAKGFAKLEPPMLFDDLDREHERSTVLLWNGRWTVLLHSEAREEERLRFELSTIGLPVLHLWCRDAEGWGYSLFGAEAPEREAISAWASSPRRRAELASDDLDALARHLGHEGELAALRRARRRSVGEPDAAARGFAELLGVPVAAAAYPGPSTYDGFSVERRVFRRRDYDPMAGFDLHALRAMATVAPPHANDWSALAEAIGVAEARRLRRLTVVARWLSGGMRVLKTPWVLAHRAHLALRHRRRAASLRESFQTVSEHPGLRRVPDHPDLLVEACALTNRRHGLRLKWSPDADIAAADISGVLPLRVGATPVVCRALRGGMASRMLTRRVGEIEIEEDYMAAGWRAKRVRSRLPQVDPPLVLEEHYVQTPDAVYVFGVGPAARLDEGLADQLRELVGGLDKIAGTPDQDDRSRHNASTC